MKKDCSHKISESEIKEILSKNGISKTKIKLKMLLEISKSPKPISVAELHQKLKDLNCDISSVFRSITQFREKNIIQEINTNEGFLRYDLNLQDHEHHHHHVRCFRCNNIQAIHECELSKFEKIVSKMGFTQITHRLEFTGLCKKCSN